MEGAELDLLEGPGDRAWAAVRRVVLEIHDVEGAKRRVVSLLRDRGFQVGEHQDEPYRGTGFSVIHAVEA